MPDTFGHPAARRMQSMTQEQAEHHRKRIAEGRRDAADQRARRAEAIRSGVGQIDLTLVAYDVATAAALTCLSERYVRQAIDNGELEARKVGRRILIENATLREWIARMAKVSPARDPEAA